MMKLMFLLLLLGSVTVVLAFEKLKNGFGHKLGPNHRHKNSNIKPIIIPLTQKLMSGHEIAQLHKENLRSMSEEEKIKSGGKFLQYIYKKDYLLANVSIGYPSNLDGDCVKFQKFQLSVETGTPDTFVFSNEFKLINKTTQKAYNPADSAASQLVNKNFSSISGNLFINGSTYQDIVNLQNYVLKSPFGVADNVKTVERLGRVGFPIDGVLGFSWTNATHSSSLVGHICNEFLKKHNYCWFMIWLETHKKPSKGQSQGQLTFGNFDREHCSGSLVQHLYSKEYNNTKQVWIFPIKSFKFGNYVNTIFKFASIDSGFSEIILPEDEYNNVINYIDPLYDTETNLLTVDCSKINILPNLTFAIEGYDKLVNMNVTSSNYVLDLDLPNNQCALAIGPSQSAYASNFILGNPFIRSYCVYYQVFPYNDFYIEFNLPLN